MRYGLCICAKKRLHSLKRSGMEDYYEISTSIRNYFMHFVPRRTTAYIHTAAHSRKRIRACPDAYGFVYRKIEIGASERNLRFSHRNYACDVYSGGGRTFGFMAFPQTHVHTNNSYHLTYHRNCDGGDGLDNSAPPPQIKKKAEKRAG